MLCLMLLVGLGAADTEAERSAQAGKIARAAVDEYTVKLGSDRLTLLPDPLLKTANPVKGSAYGSVFLWTLRGHPEVLTTAHKNYAPGTHLGVEFNSLTGAPVTAERNGEVVWHPERPGVEWKLIPGAPAVASTPAGRLRQMAALSREFSANHTDENGLARDLRLLSKPLYRYGESRTGDGALFVFTQGTDPEALLMIEARDQWCYALARMTYMEVNVSHRGKKAWGVPLVPWWTTPSKLRDPAEVFTEFVFPRGSGVNPASP